MGIRRRQPIPLKLGESIRSVSNELVMNGYAEPVDGGAKGQVTLRSHPGLGQFLDAAATYRGSISLNDFPLVVWGTTLYRFTDIGNLVSLGTIPGTGYVIAAGGLDETVFLNTNGDSYRYTSGGGVAQVTDGDYQQASSVTNLNGTTIWSVADTADFIWSSPADASAIDPLDLASESYKSDKLVRAYEHKADLLLFGTYSTVGWYDTGNADTPYQRRGDLLLDVGLAGVHAVTTAADTVFFLAHDGTVRMIEGGVAVRVSNASVERRIMGDADRGMAGWDDLSLVRMFSYVWRGHLFVTVRHPDGCLQYDLTTKFWDVRKSYGSDTWRIVDAILAYNTTYLFDGNGNVYELDESTRYEDGDIVQWQAITPAIYNEGQPFNLHRVDFAVDTGRSTDPSLDPILIVEGSDDGYTFDTYEELSLGMTGDNSGLVSLDPQGQVRERTFRLTVSDDVPVALTAMWADMTPCRG